MAYRRSLPWGLALLVAFAALAAAVRCRERAHRKAVTAAPVAAVQESRIPQTGLIVRCWERFPKAAERLVSVPATGGGAVDPGEQEALWALEARSGPPVILESPEWYSDGLLVRHGEVSLRQRLRETSDASMEREEEGAVWPEVMPGVSAFAISTPTRAEEFLVVAPSAGRRFEWVFSLEGEEHSFALEDARLEVRDGKMGEWWSWALARGEEMNLRRSFTIRRPDPGLQAQDSRSGGT